MTISSNPLVRKLVMLSLEEDLSFGDITSELAISPTHRSQAAILAREKLVVCGLPLLNLILELRGGANVVDVRTKVADGDEVGAGTVLATLVGCTVDLLGLERTMLNFLQRLSGVSTFTREVVRSAPGLMILDTRKTVPGFRVLDKYAVRAGGGRNHRMHLGDMVLVKNNHIDAHGGVESTLNHLTKRKPPYMPLEIEVRDLQELRSALPFDPTIIMLDNMRDDQIKEALDLVKRESPRTLVEVSGGISFARLGQLRALGVELVSMGALTTQARNVDISMRIEQGVG